MNLRTLRNRPVEWLRGGPDSDVVISCRVRLARNVDGYPFVWRATSKQRARLEELLRNAIAELDLAPPLSYVRVDELGGLTRELLLERHLISREHAEADWVRGVAFDDCEQTSVMVNEEDHLRMHFLRGGLRLREAYERVNALDDRLAERIPYAFSPKYGYLTACPVHAGTGMRAGVVVHLPGVVMSQETASVVEIATRRNLAVRGAYGEGTHGAGDFYHLYNQVTLGVEEQEIVRNVHETALETVKLERTARRNLAEKHPDELRGRIFHALDLLSTASTLSSQETLNFLSQVRMGVELELLEAPDLAAVNDLLLLTLPAHLQTIQGRELDSSVRNQLRADYIKERLATG